MQPPRVGSMAPRGRGGKAAQQNAKAKPAAKRASRRAAAPTSRPASPAPSAVPEAAPEQMVAASPLPKDPACSNSEAGDSCKRRRLFRRDSDERVERVLARKLSHLDSAMIASRRNSAGKSVRDVIRDALRDLAPRRKYLASSFWVQLYTDFELNSAVFDTLPAAPDLPVADELLEALLPASAENPAHRSSEPLQLFLEYAPASNKAHLPPVCGSTGDQARGCIGFATILWAPIVPG